MAYVFDYKIKKFPRALANVRRAHPYDEEIKMLDSEEKVYEFEIVYE